MWLIFMANWGTFLIAFVIYLIGLSFCHGDIGSIIIWSTILILYVLSGCAGDGEVYRVESKVNSIEEMLEKIQRDLKKKEG